MLWMWDYAEPWKWGTGALTGVGREVKVYNISKGFKQRKVMEMLSQEDLFGSMGLLPDLTRKGREGVSVLLCVA